MPIGISLLGFSYLNDYIISNNNILILLFSGSLVMLTDKIAFTNKTINYLATSVLAIYLLTDAGFWRDSLDTYLLDKILQGHGIPYVIGISLCCILIDKIRDFLFLLFKKLIAKL